MGTQEGEEVTDDERKRKQDDFIRKMLSDNAAGLRNFLHALETCDRCGAHNKLGTPVCGVCGHELIEYGKH